MLCISSAIHLTCIYKYRGRPLKLNHHGRLEVEAQKGQWHGIPDICHWHHSGSAGVKIFSLVSKKCELVCFRVKIMNFVFFGVKKSGISVFLVSIENGAGVQKMTNIRYVWVLSFQEGRSPMNQAVAVGASQRCKTRQMSQVYLCFSFQGCLILGPCTALMSGLCH